MGLKIFDEKEWWEISREERFFCAQLYFDVLNKFPGNKQAGIKDFVKFINSEFNLKLDEDVFWDFGYEVCFDRDFKYFKTKKSLQTKRTFDLCLMSEKQFVIIEAKAQGGFSEKQMKDFKMDKQRVNSVFEIVKEEKPGKIKLIALASSEYRPKKSTVNNFDAWLTWIQLFEFYSDKVFKKADEVYGK